MPGPLPRVSPGDPLQIDAATWNAVLELVRAEVGRRLGQEGGGSGLASVQSRVDVLVRNDTGGNLAAHSVLAVGDSLADPAGSPLPYQARPVFEGTTPAAITDTFAVLQEPAEDGGIGKGVVLGVVVATVNVTDEDHTAATPTASSAAKLTSAASGPAVILWKSASGTGDKTAVLLLTGQSPGESGCNFRYTPISGGVTNYTPATLVNLLEANGWNLPGGDASDLQLQIFTATTTRTGTVTTTTQSFAGQKTFTGQVICSGAGFSVTTASATLAGGAVVSGTLSLDSSCTLLANSGSTITIASGANVRVYDSDVASLVDGYTGTLGGIKFREGLAIGSA